MSFEKKTVLYKCVEFSRRLLSVDSVDCATICDRCPAFRPSPGCTWWGHYWTSSSDFAFHSPTWLSAAAADVATKVSLLYMSPKRNIFRTLISSHSRFFGRFSGFWREFWRFLDKISDLHLDLRHPRTTSGGQISVKCSPNTFLPNETFRFPIPHLGKFPGCFPQNSHFYNGLPIPRPFL